ncbi:LOG family protein [Candidatus Deianiraea vastatrix]|uniref:AMP nucleosidase n=1 Tax=Candidatus Deianiraea vastatrix TaxID=2163644 RepID=A0A5B8XE78_9RICK|nr:LOG family protein [Candidatus Deianiraea vastatrix]QED23618.1 Putative lysine decarboxylase-related protein [Candidatus Deianiraea vastatrix]
MKISDLIARLEAENTRKSRLLLDVCRQYLPFENVVNLNQNSASFVAKNTEISPSQLLTDGFLSKIAQIEFGQNGFVFAGGSHKSISEKTAMIAEEFGFLYGSNFQDNARLATGATTKFMEIINTGLVKSGDFAITATTNFPVVMDKVNRSIKYCFRASNFTSMESFLIHNSIAGVFFEGGIGTSYEAFSMLIERQCGTISKSVPVIFVTSENNENFIHNLIENMHQNGKIYDADFENIYTANTAAQIISILKQHINIPNDNEKHEYIRAIFSVLDDKYL